MTRSSRTRLRTHLVQGGIDRSPHGETAEALFLTSGYVYDSAEQAEARFRDESQGYLYSRYANPTVRMFEERMILLEGRGAQDARATASGMAAVTASLLCFLRHGDHLVAARALFGSCRFVIETVLPQLGIATTLVDGGNLDAWQAACRPQTRAFFLESPANPTLDVIDLAAVSQIARAARARLVVDNVFATPLLQKPFDFGADVVVYSATKHIDGQGRCLGGVILGGSDYIEGDLAPFYRNTGPSLSPFNAWVMLKGLETLPLRVEAQCRSAEALARFLEDAPAIRRVLYPGLPSHPQAALAARQMRGGGTLLAFELAGGKDAAFRFANALRLIRISNNLGDAKSLITHPATTTHSRLAKQARSQMGISDSLLRLSVGLEDSEDLKEDLARALAAA